MVASEDFSRGNFSVERFCLICFNISTKQPILVSHFEKSDSAQFNSLFFSEVLIEDSNGRRDINSFVLPFFGFMVEAVVEVGESSARVWPFGTLC